MLTNYLKDKYGKETAPQVIDLTCSEKDRLIEMLLIGDEKRSEIAEIVIDRLINNLELVECVYGEDKHLGGVKNMLYAAFEQTVTEIIDEFNDES